MSELTPVSELVKKNKTKNPNETSEYRRSRNELLAAELELRRHITRVAELRRKLPLGGEVKEDFSFVGEKGPVKLSDLFGDKKTLLIYSYMFRPKKDAPCPMCTSFMRVWAKKITDVQQKASFVFVARGPIEQLLVDKPKRGLEALPVYSDTDGAFTRTYVNAEDADMPAMNVFVKRDGRIYHFWRDETNSEMADPGHDPGGGVDMDSLWNLLDLTPEGRGADWYPKLSYS